MNIIIGNKAIKDAKLPKRFKTKWIEALRNGEYQQGNSQLKTSSNKYCCLGVACEISKTKVNFLGKTFIDEIDFSDKELKLIKVPKILKFSNNTLTEKLASFNDRNKSFKWIASWIERYL